MKAIKFIFLSACSALILLWISFVAVRHAEGDIILTSRLGWTAPHVRSVSYGLLRGEEQYNQVKASGGWYGGDVLYEGVPRWVLIIPCPRWMGHFGGDWYGASEGYSRWIPNSITTLKSRIFE